MRLATLFVAAAALVGAGAVAAPASALPAAAPHVDGAGPLKVAYDRQWRRVRGNPRHVVIRSGNVRPMHAWGGERWRGGRVTHRVVVRDVRVRHGGYWRAGVWYWGVPTVRVAVVSGPHVWSGRRYCWYDDGWHGAGWYWCKYAWRSGVGWGGGWGWRGWAVSSVRYSSWRDWDRRGHGRVVWQSDSHRGHWTGNTGRRWVMQRDSSRGHWAGQRQVVRVNQGSRSRNVKIIRRPARYAY